MKQFPDPKFEISRIIRTYRAKTVINVFLALSLQNLSLHAAEIEVANAGDSGPGSLRQAIFDANPGDIVKIPNSLMITLTSGPLIVDKELTIEALSLETTIPSPRISGGGNSRIFELGLNADLTLEKLSLEFGRAPDEEGMNPAGDGGAIVVDGGSLNVKNSHFAFNRAGDGTSLTNGGKGGAIANLGNGSIIIEDSSFRGNGAGNGGIGGAGGAIFTAGGFLSVQRSEISGNEAGFSSTSSGGDGGGIASYGGHVSIKDSAIEANDAGNGPAQGGSGGGVAVISGTFSIENSTIAGNIAGSGDAAGSGGGISVGNSSGVVQNVTVTGNVVYGTGSFPGKGGGLQVISGAVNVESSIIADNSVSGGNSASSHNLFNDFGTVTRDGANLIGINTSIETEFPEGVPNGNGDLVGTFANPIDALLGPLADNGGPTPTRLPYLGSPAIDPPGGPGTSSLSEDQRGFLRVVGGVLDIGAVEVQVGEAVPKPPPSTETAAGSAAKSTLAKKIGKLKKKLRKAKKRNQKGKVSKFKRRIKKLSVALRRL